MFPIGVVRKNATLLVPLAILVLVKDDKTNAKNLTKTLRLGDIGVISVKNMGLFVCLFRVASPKSQMTSFPVTCQGCV